jgi:hypothetical protein
MTAPLYKQQAARLAEHFSSVHKMRLKHASSLEAVAALHGMKDWNTLVANPVPSIESAPAAPVSLASALSLLFPAKSVVDREFCAALLSVQSRIQGDAATERTALSQQLLAYQVKRGGFIYLQCGDAKMPDVIARVMAQEGNASLLRIVDWFAPDVSETYNPLEGMTAEEVSDAALNLLPLTDGSPGAEFYRQNSRYALRSIASAMLELRVPVTFRTLAEAFTQPETVLLDMEQLLPPGGAAGEHFSSFLDTYRTMTKSGPGLDRDSFYAHVGGFAGRLAKLSAGSLGKIFNAASSSVSVRAALEKGLCVFLRSATLEAATGFHLTKVILASLESALAHSRDTKNPPFTIFVSGYDVSKIWSKQLSSLAQKAGVGVVFVEQSAISSAPVIWDTDVTVSAAQGLGGSARVMLRHRPTNRTQEAIL